MRNHLTRWLLSLSFAAGLWVAPAFGQIGVFQGVVKDKTTGQPIKDVVITIDGIEMKRTYTVKTDKNGKYIHAGVSLQGTYRITAKKEGYQTDGINNAKAGFGVEDQRGMVDFNLSPGQSGKMAFEMSPEEQAKAKKEAEDAKSREASVAELKGFFNQGLQLVQAGQYDQAIEAFKKAGEKDPSQYAVWANLGNAYSKVKQYDLAVESYNKAIALKPADPGLYQNLGAVYSESGNTDKSKEMYEKAASLAVATDPKAAATQYYNIGVTYINKGQNAEAEQALKKALEIDPTHAETHYQLGLTELGLNNLDEAIVHLKKYVELVPNGENTEVAKQLIQQLSAGKK